MTCLIHIWNHPLNDKYHCPLVKKNIEKHIQRYDEARLDYLEFFDPNTFKTRNMIRTGTHMALAVYFGKTRLIDNGRL